MKTTLFLLIALSAASCGHRNLSDPIDANTTPAPMEQREDEFINSSDAIDANEVESINEEREQQEESILEDENDLYEADGFYE